MSLKSLFVKEDLVVPKTKTYTIPSEMKMTTVVTTNPFLTVASQNVDPDIKSALLQSLQDNKYPGFDYLKFVATLDEMKSVAPNEDVRFKMTFIAAKQVGADKNSLVGSANHYIDVLKDDLKDFKANLGSKFTETVELNQNRLNEVTKNILALQNQLQQLTEDSTKLTSIISESKVKLENKKSAFETTHASIVNEINTNIEKINQYL